MSADQLKGGLYVGPDGLVHTTFTHDPSTFRLSAKNPNLQNIPRDGVARQMFVAPPGQTFWAVDYAGIENILVGWLAKSDRYVRLSKLDMHSFYTAYSLADTGVLTQADVPQESWPDEQLAACLADLKKRFKRERQAHKPLVHGGNYLMGPGEAQETILKELRVVVPLKTIKKRQGFYFELFPEIREWHRRVTGLDEAVDAAVPWEGAYQKGYLRTPFGNIHRYYDVLTHVKGPKGWELRYSTDAKRAVAFVPQSSARMVLTRAALRLPSFAQDTLRLFVHDEMLGLCSTEDVAAVVQAVQAEMERPVPELGGLVLPTAPKVGQSWGEMK